MDGLALEYQGEYGNAGERIDISDILKNQYLGITGDIYTQLDSSFDNIIEHNIVFYCGYSEKGAKIAHNATWTIIFDIFSESLVDKFDKIIESFNDRRSKMHGDLKIEIDFINW